MPEDFKYDVFLSHSAKDKPAVRPIAERLKEDGLKVWLDDWEIHPGDSIPAKIEEGLEHSRVLVLCMSANAFGSDWAQLESGTFRFRDPLNKDRRFIPLRLDDAPIKGSLAQFLYINWYPTDREQEYAKLLEACRKPETWPCPARNLEHVSLRQDHNQPETVKVVTQRLLKYPGGFSWQISIANSQSQGQVSIHHIGVATVFRHYYVHYLRVSPRPLSKVVVSRLKDLSRSYDGRLVSAEAATSVDVIGDDTYLLNPGEIETFRVPFILDADSEMLVCLGLVVDYTTHEGERRTAISDCVLAADAREMSVAKYDLASLRKRRIDTDTYSFENDVVIECFDQSDVRVLPLGGIEPNWGSIFDDCISFLDGSKTDFRRLETDEPEDPSPQEQRAQQSPRVVQRARTVATPYLIPQNLTADEALQAALSTAVAVGGRAANLVEIMQIPGAIFDGKSSYLPVSEEIVAHDRHGKFAEENGIVFLTIHGLGVLTPEVLAKARRIGYVGNNSANLATLFPDEDVVSTILNEGFLPDGRRVEVVAFDNYRTNGIRDCSKVHCVVRRRDQAVYPDFNSVTDLADNPQVIAYCGGKRRTQVLLSRLREKNIGRFHTRNILFFSDRYFRDKACTELIAPVANPLCGPCDGLYGCWPLPDRDCVFGRYLVLWEEAL